MSRFEGPQGIVTNGLVLNLDAGDPDSYTRSQPPYVEVLVVAGGGGGGGSTAGGGGAGGVIYNSAYQITNAAAITVTVGAGGAGSQKSNDGSPNNTNGANSVFGSLTAIGGGYGFSGRPAGSRVANSGGSGGGAGFFGGNDILVSPPGAGTPGQGFSGGPVVNYGFDWWGGAGGGGAGGEGAANVQNNSLRTGGPGLPFSISGTSTYYGGGGGGGCFGNGTGPSPGGQGGGGNGGDGSSFIATSGTSNTGGGGGGSGFYQNGPNPSGGNGGSGIVIVRYPGLPAATGGTITYLNGYTIHTFTSSGTFTPFLWNDVSGNGNNGTLVNGVGFNSYQNGGTLTFDGVDDRVATSFKPSGYRSYFIWVKYNITSSLPAGYSLTGTQEVNAYNYVGIENGGKFYYYFGTNGESLAGTVLSPNIWYYQGLTLSSDGNARAYLNGTLVSTLASGVGTTATAEFSVGAINQNHWVNGSIASVVQYNRTLSQAEITQNYNAQKARFGL
jgi:hypothetical protein